MGVDVAVEALGRPQTFMQCVQSVRDGGKAVMIGLTLAGAKGEVDINHLVRRQVFNFCPARKATCEIVFQILYLFSYCLPWCFRKPRPFLEILF